MLGAPHLTPSARGAWRHQGTGQGLTRQPGGQPSRSHSHPCSSTGNSRQALPRLPCPPRHQGDETRCPRPSSGSPPPRGKTACPLEGVPKPRPPRRTVTRSVLAASVGTGTTLTLFPVAPPTRRLPRYDRSATIWEMEQT